MNIPFSNPTVRYREHQVAIDDAIRRVMVSGSYTLGSECAMFEAEFADMFDDSHAIGVASGHDALLLALKGLGVGPGDEVITVANTAVDTVAAIYHSGATPVLIDVERRTGTLDARHLDSALSEKTKAIVPVHLYGHPANMLPIVTFARQHELNVIEDCSQAPGARYQGQMVGTMGRCGIFSFHPHCALGGFGDGGAIVTDDAQLASTLRRLREATPMAETPTAHIPYTSRLDEIQSAVLRILLQSFMEEIEKRRLLASIYNELLRDLPVPILTPVPLPGCRHNYHRYVIQTLHRDQLGRHLGDKGIATAVHYRRPVHLQSAFSFLGYQKGDLPITEQLATMVLSLPLYPSLKIDDVDIIARYARQFTPSTT